ncbi:MAG: ABC transporter permease subunit [Thermoplasmata archaeon]|nr:MAG: ABC transporter permease subunit [Thermoplasmata archaeon]
MGIRAIEYRPWKGARTDPNQRWLVISKHVFQKNVRAKAVIVLLIFGMMLAHAFPIIGAILFPHEEITDEDMRGADDIFREDPEPEHEFDVIEGDLNFTGDLRIQGTFKIEGELSVTGSINMTGGSLSGVGSINGWAGDINMLGMFLAFSPVNVSGLITMGNISELMSAFMDGNGTGEPPIGGPGGIPPELLLIFQALGNLTTVEGTGTISGFGTISGNGTVVGDYSEPEPEIDFTGGEGYLTSPLFIIFTMLLAAIICADIIAADLADSSFVLYFSRHVRSLDYLLGKFVGLLWVMWLFCLIPPIAYVLVMMGTQTGDDFSGGLTILGKTIIAGLITAIYFLPYGLMISSFTKSKAYAGIGIFMSFFVLSIVAEIFSGNSDYWTLIDPFQLLYHMFKIMFNGTIPDDITSGMVAGAILAFTVIPMAVVIFWIQRKGAGK